MQLSRQLINSARQRFGRAENRTEADLRRAVSDTYYAMFHCICESLSAPLLAAGSSTLVNTAYCALYRFPEHKKLADRCRCLPNDQFPNHFVSFARQFASMRQKRNEADYDPLVQIVYSEVENDLNLSARQIADFQNSDQIDQLGFAMLVAGISKNR